MAYVVKLTIPGASIDAARANIERLRKLFLAASQAEADMFELLAWEIESKHAELRTRRLRRRAA